MITSRGPSHRALSAICGFALLLSACSDGELPTAEPTIETTLAPPETSSDPTPDSDQGEPDPGESVVDGGWTGCEQIAIDSDARIERVELVETSGLAASGRFEDIVWAHNDSGGAAGVYAVGLDGSDNGFFGLAGQTGIDIEDIAMVDGEIYLADIGDNNRVRDSVQIYRFDEPDPGADAGGSVTEASISEVSIIDVAYPDEPTDAEALLVDPLSDEVIILSKDLEAGEVATRIYSFAMPTGSSDSSATETITMDLVGEIDVAALESQATDFSLTAVLFPGLLTAADISADGRLIAVRTYGTVWLYPRAADQTMADALLGQPCEGGTAAETQGEALTFLQNADGDEPGTVRYATASEGNNPVLSVVSVGLD